MPRMETIFVRMIRIDEEPSGAVRGALGGQLKNRSNELPEGAAERGTPGRRGARPPRSVPDFHAQSPGVQGRAGGKAPGLAAQQAQCGEEAGGCIDHVVRGGGLSGEAAQVGGDVGEVR